MYMFFMVWRYQKRLEHYSGMKGPFYGGEYHVALPHSFPVVCLRVLPACRFQRWSYAVQGRFASAFDHIVSMSGANQNLASLCRVLQRLSVG